MLHIERRDKCQISLRSIRLNLSKDSISDQVDFNETLTV